MALNLKVSLALVKAMKDLKALKVFLGLQVKV